MKRIHFILPVFIMTSSLYLHAQDGWYLQKLQEKVRTVRSLFALDKDTVIAVGYSGTLLRTTNSGISWVSQPLNNNTKTDLYHVHFINHHEGWIVGDFGEIYQTTDSGHSWQLRAKSRALFSV